MRQRARAMRSSTRASGGTPGRSGTYEPVSSPRSRGPCHCGGSPPVEHLMWHLSMYGLRSVRSFRGSPGIAPPTPPKAQSIPGAASSYPGPLRARRRDGLTRCEVGGTWLRGVRFGSALKARHHRTKGPAPAAIRWSSTGIPVDAPVITQSAAHGRVVL